MNSVNETLKSVGLIGSSAEVYVAVLATTNPVYMCFAQGDRDPRYAVRFSDDPSLLKDYDVNQMLYRLSPELIVRPLCCGQNQFGYYYIQEAAEGRPWFTLRNDIKNSQDWRNLCERSINTLNTFHHALLPLVNGATICMQQVLKNCVDDVEDGVLPAAFSELYSSIYRELSSSGPFSAVKQHGDFCLNNMLFSDDSVTLIDFEDFGVNNWPLHDACSLALSLYQMGDAIDNNKGLDFYIDIVTFRLRDVIGLDFKYVKCCFIVFLVSRLGSWSKSQKREVYRSKLVSLLNEVCSEY